QIDMIVSNPPYLTEAEMNDLQREVSFEPSEALYGGTDGLNFYRVISCLWGERLRTGGMIAFETGDRQAADVSQILRDSGFEDISVIQYAGLDRVVTARKKA
ncbi:MAG: peptide chain release factor N(5)-glutamine methyltransferase, partial [Oscillospiraceae bacterium]|nr:peptide chain release factor N(5)-glutamine methyltransferase [Oscillospiraceae bacterium]